MLDDLIISADSLSISLGMGLSMSGCRGVAQWSEHLQLKQEPLGSISGGCPGFFLFQLAQLLMLMG